MAKKKPRTNKKRIIPKEDSPIIIVFKWSLVIIVVACFVSFIIGKISDSNKFNPEEDTCDGWQNCICWCEDCKNIYGCCEVDSLEDEVDRSPQCISWHKKPFCEKCLEIPEDEWHRKGYADWQTSKHNRACQDYCICEERSEVLYRGMISLLINPDKNSLVAEPQRYEYLFEGINQSELDDLKNWSTLISNKNGDNGLTQYVGDFPPSVISSISVSNTHIKPLDTIIFYVNMSYNLNKNITEVIISLTDPNGITYHIVLEEVNPSQWVRNWTFHTQGSWFYKSVSAVDSTNLSSTYLPEIDITISPTYTSRVDIDYHPTGNDCIKPREKTECEKGNIDYILDGTIILQASYKCNCYNLTEEKIYASGPFLSEVIVIALEDDNLIVNDDIIITRVNETEEYCDVCYNYEQICRKKTIYDYSCDELKQHIWLEDSYCPCSNDWVWLCPCGGYNYKYVKRVYLEKGCEI